MTKAVTMLDPAILDDIIRRVVEENGINVQAAASLILQAALARRINGLVPK